MNPSAPRSSMKIMLKRRCLDLLSGMAALTAVALLAPSNSNAAASVAEGRHAFTFTLGTNDFLLDGKPFLIRSGEIHPERIPKEYWRHRVRMAKAMGLNTIALYLMWNAF